MSSIFQKCGKLSVMSCSLLAAAGAWAGPADMGRTLKGADLAPASTVFYSEIPSVAIFFRDFWVGHMTAGSLPMVKAAELANGKSPLLNVEPRMASPALSKEFNLMLWALKADHLFGAITPAPGKGMRFLAGGCVTDPRKALVEWKASVSKVVPGLAWQTSDSGDVLLMKTMVPKVGELQMAACAGWIFAATDPSALADALAILQSQKPSGPSLASTAAWQANTDAQSHDLLFIYYTRVEALAPLLDTMNLKPTARFLRSRFSGLQAFSWSWTTKGAGSQPYDRLVATLDDSTAGELARLVEPLDEPHALIGPDTVYSMAFRARLASLLQTPVYSGLAITEQGKRWLAQLGARGESESEVLDVALLVDHPVGSFHSAWVIRAPESWSPGISKKSSTIATLKTADALYVIVAEDAASMRYFRARLEIVGKEGRSKATSPVDTLPLLDGSFFELRLDRARIATDYLAALRKNSDRWRPALEERGMVLPDPLPDFQPERWLGPMRLGCALRGNQLVLDNYFQLHETASTVITSSSILGVQAYGPEILARMRYWEGLHHPSDAKGDAPNLFSTVIESPLFFGPSFSSDSVYILGLDLMAHYHLANPPPLPAQKKP